ncbi:hypothetical protein ACVBEQ_04665 [Nakamurella sp. GG22]
MPISVVELVARQNTVNTASVNTIAAAVDHGVITDNTLHGKARLIHPAKP